MQPYGCTVVPSNATLQCRPRFSTISHRLSSFAEGMAYFHPGLVRAENDVTARDTLVILKRFNFDDED